MNYWYYCIIGQWTWKSIHWLIHKCIMWRRWAPSQTKAQWVFNNNSITVALGLVADLVSLQTVEGGRAVGVAQRKLLWALGWKTHTLQHQKQVREQQTGRGEWLVVTFRLSGSRTTTEFHSSLYLLCSSNSHKVPINNLNGNTVLAIQWCGCSSTPATFYRCQ